MKKLISGFIMAAMLAVMVPFLSTSANAQTYVRTYRAKNGVTYVRRTNKKPSFYRKHRNLSNIGIGTVGGAILGGLIGGKKGALLGAAAGAGGSALYTYKLNPKRTRYYKVRRY
jgi:outer membrane lipoprotein SlyB